jgi:hypothetical protein
MRPLAWVYAASAALGTLLAIRMNEPAGFAGIRTGRSAGFDAAIGYGTGISAPWTVVAPLLFFAGRKDRKSRNVVMALSLAALVGQMVEPAVRAITWRQNPGAKAVTVVNVAIPMAMLYASRNGFGTVGS